MKKLLLYLIFAFYAFIPMEAAYARGGIPIPYFTSTEEELHKIQKVDLGEGSMYLGYKTTGTYLFSFLELSINNDGYVLIPENGSDRYIELSSEKLASMKEISLLPKDLPDSPSMSLGTILKGYFFTLCIGIFFIWVIIAAIKAEKTTS